MNHPIDTRSWTPHRPTAFLVGLACIAAVLQAWSPAARSSEPPASPPSDGLAVGVHRMPREVGWGYGCGGHCAMNTRGASEVVLTVADDGTVTLTDQGSEAQTFVTPDDSTTETRTWRSRWTGHITAGAGPVAQLQATDRECTVERSGAQESRTRCSPPATLTLSCAAAVVPIDTDAPAGSGAQTAPDEAVWQCDGGGEGEGWGTPLPWIFGRTRTVGVRFVGEPTAQNHYVAPWKTE